MYSKKFLENELEVPAFSISIIVRYDRPTMRDLPYIASRKLPVICLHWCIIANCNNATIAARFISTVFERYRVPVAESLKLRRDYIGLAKHPVHIIHIFPPRQNELGVLVMWEVELFKLEI